MAVQLPLSIALPETTVFGNYMQGDNAVALGLCKQLSVGQGEKQFLIWGDTAVGKTHLLQAVCNHAAESGRLASYLPLKDVFQYGPELLEGLDQFDLVCIDDVQLCAGQAVWEKALFSFINRCRSSKAQLLFSANNTPSELRVELPDLRSRLSWGAVVQIVELADEEKLLWLQQRAQRQGLNMPTEVARYLLRHYPRDMHSQDKLLAELNTASLAAQRRLTVAFVKEIHG
jgi:DnaA family protein